MLQKIATKHPVRGIYTIKAVTITFRLLMEPHHRGIALHQINLTIHLATLEVVVAITAPLIHRFQ